MDSAFKLFYYAGVINNYMGKPVLKKLIAFNTICERDEFLEKSNFNRMLTLADIQDWCEDDFDEIVESAIFDCLNPSY